jgi:hypothetical protein
LNTLGIYPFFINTLRGESRKKWGKSRLSSIC